MQGWADVFPAWLQSWVAVVSGLAVILIAVVASIHAALSQREVRSSIGWIGLILMVPFVGGILYALFGVNRIRRAAVELRGDAGTRPYDLAPGSRAGGRDDVARHFVQRPAFAEIARVVSAVTQRPLLAGNRIAPLLDGDEAYPAMLEAIGAAEKSITLASYIFDNDLVGRRFVDALEEAVRRGVQVRVIVDAAGAQYSFPRIDKLLSDRGIPTRRFMPIRPGRLRYFNLRSHRKTLVVDGRVGFTGGMNIRHGHWLKLSPKNPVRDIHFRLEGPVVSQLQEVFAEDWEFTSGEALRGEEWFPTLQPSGPTLARGIKDGPDRDRDILNWTLLGAIGSATRSIRIATPYFLPDPPVTQALNLAAMRGVEVDIVLPARSNLRYMDWAMWGQFWTILGQGVRLWLSPPPFDHSKLLVVDDYWVLFGSSNWDSRSLRLNFEFNVEAYCEDLGRQTVGILNERVAASRLITSQDLSDRGAVAKVRDAVARLASPYL